MYQLNLNNMILTDEIVKQLLAIDEFDSFEESQDTEDYSISLRKEDNKTIIEIEKKKDSDLRTFINKLNDDLFIKACNKVEEYTGKSLNVWNQNYSEESILNMFKNVTSRLLEDESESLQKNIDNLKNALS